MCLRVIITRSNILIIVVISELILIFILLKILDQKNIILFYFFNIVSRFTLFIRLFINNHLLFLLANIIKLGFFPFTFIILMFYVSLKMINFIMLNIAKLPYLYLLNIRVIYIFTVRTVLYVIYYLYNTNNILRIATVYRVVSRVIISNIRKKLIGIYYVIRLLRIWMFLVGLGEVVRTYNLIRLPFRLTFYVKIQFLLSLNWLILRFFCVRITFLIFQISKYLAKSNSLSKVIIYLLVTNSLII